MYNNTNMMVTSTNTKTTFTDMAADNLSILINASVQVSQSDP